MSQPVPDNDDIVTRTDEALSGAQVPGDGGSGPSTEGQILGDADLTDIPGASIEDAEMTAITEDTDSIHIVDEDELDQQDNVDAMPHGDTTLRSTAAADPAGEDGPAATLGDSGETLPT
ncbi:MAG: hypothetical protein R2687_10115 [Candidatus Nanopelagicales bacterium]